MNDFFKENQIKFCTYGDNIYFIRSNVLIRPDITNKIIVIILGLIITLYGILR